MDDLPYGGEALIRHGLRFSCQGCGECCRGPGGHVFLTEGEGGQIAAHLGISTAAFFSTMTRHSEGRLALADMPNGDCRFLGEDGCAIYPVRPRQCRSWPFWFANLRSREAWKSAAQRCPGIGKGDLHCEAEILSWL
jgi:Fe-S-cluster containining protein